MQIKNLPPDTKTLVITFDDLDHPIQPGFNHWVAWNIPPVATIPANIPKGATVENPIHIEQGSAYGKNCYRGPKPPFNWNHRYVFTVYALNCNLELKANANKEEVLALAKNHILTKGELYGKYQRKRK